MYKNILLYGLAEGLTRLTPFVSTLLLAAYLPAEEFGSISLLIVSYEIIFILISNNIQATTKIDFFKLETEQLFNLKKSHLINSLIITIPVAILMYLLFGISAFFSALLVIFALFRTYIIYILTMLQCNKKIFDYISIVVIYVIVFLFALWSTLPYGISSLIIALGSAYTAQLIFIYFKYASHNFILLKCGVVKLSCMSVALNSGLLFMPQAIGWWMKIGVDRFLVNRFYGVESLASFSLAFQFSALLLMGVIALNLAMVPELNTHLLNRNIQKAKQVLKLGCGVIILGSILVLGIGIFLIDHYYISKYQIAGVFFPLFLLSIIPQCFVLILTNVLYFTDHKVFVATSVLLVSVLQSLFNYIFIHKIGLNGLIYSALLFNSILLFVINLKAQKILKDI